jgi:hypothetical protein
MGNALENVNFMENVYIVKNNRFIKFNIFNYIIKKMGDKLKTLKDIEVTGCSCDRCEQCYGITRYLSEEEIKQEGIEWIKSIKEVQKKGDTLFNEHGKLNGLNINIFDYEQDDSIGMIKFIKHFFNIIEEDLK